MTYLATVFLDYADVDPALAIDQVHPADVVDVLASILAMVCAFVVEADHRLVVTHIDECFAKSVADPDLCSRSRQTSVDQDQAQARLLGRLSPAVHQCKRYPSAPDTASTPILVGQGDHLVECHTRRSGQRIEMWHRDVAGQMAGDVQCRTGRCRDGQLTDEGNFVS